MRKAFGRCLDPRVLAGLAAVGVLVWITAPSLLGAVVPLLLVAACPLSMLAMAWMMRGQMSGPSGDPSARLAALEREQQRIADEIARTQTQVATQRPATAVGRHPGRGDAA